MSSVKNPTSKENLQVEKIKIHHEGFAYEDYRQEIIQRAYDIGGMDLVILIECENGNWNPTVTGDYGDAYGLCQMNRRFHKIPQQYYEDWGFQVEYCNQKLKGGTKFYGPSRILPNGQICKKGVLDRFTFTG